MTLAHAGGWDELLVLIVPLVLIALVLWLANRLGNKAGDLAEAETEADR